MTEKRRLGFTMIEVLVVCGLVLLILSPAVSLFISSRKSASSGLDKLEMLNRARFIMEKVQRDLKALCSDGSHGFLPLATETVTLSFPVFPAVSGARNFGNTVPLNLVAYAFDPRSKTLFRTLTFHPLVAEPGRPSITERLGDHVASFTIKPRQMLGLRYYDVELTYLSSLAPGQEGSPIVLRMAVQSEYETRLQRHQVLINNRQPVFSFPP